MTLPELHKSLKLRADIALARDEASRFLPWIIALMVYLAMMILAGSFMLSSTIAASHRAEVQSFSVHLPHAASEHDVSTKVLDIIKNTSGVTDAEIVSPARIQEMVEPWFGKGDVLASLPLPVIIDAKVDNNTVLSYDALKAAITPLVPGATIDDHKQWITEFSVFVGVVQKTLLFVAVLIMSTTACVVVFACKTSLKIHRGTVALLHRLGAMDSYIAQQFQNHAALLALKGSFIGCGFASFTIVGLHLMAHRIHSPLFPSFALSPPLWLILFVLPLLMTALALVVARISVLGNLQRMP